MGLLGRIWGSLGALGRGLSKTRAGRYLASFGSRRKTLIVAAMMLCGAVVLLAWGVLGVLEAQRDSDSHLPTGDLAGIVTPAGPNEPTLTATATPRATATPTGRDKATPTPAATPLPQVAPPMRMVIEKIGVDAPIITMGLDANSWPEVPYDPDVVAWYNFSAKPGQGSNAVFAGHVDWTVNGQPVAGVFWGLRELEEGDVVKLLLEDDSELRYRVTQNLAIGHDDPEGLKLMYKTPNDVITLISCGGTWVPDPSNPLGGNYTHRTVVRAELVT